MSCEIEINHSTRLRLIINGFTRLILFRVFEGVPKKKPFLSTHFCERTSTLNGFETFANLQVGGKKLFKHESRNKIVSRFYLRKKINVSRCRQVPDNEHFELFSGWISSSSNCRCFVVGHTLTNTQKHTNTHITFCNKDKFGRHFAPYMTQFYCETVWFSNELSNYKTLQMERA